VRVRSRALNRERDAVLTTAGGCYLAYAPYDPPVQIRQHRDGASEGSDMMTPTPLCRPPAFLTNPAIPHQGRAACDRSGDRSEDATEMNKEFHS
jgi:hypothetical protein